MKGCLGEVAQGGRVILQEMSHSPDVACETSCSGSTSHLLSVS